MRNVVFENIFYNCKENPDSTVFDLDINTRPHTLECVFARNIFAGNATCAVDMKHCGELVISGLYGENVREKIRVADGGSVILDGEKI
jgi:hypothetical protein